MVELQQPSGLHKNPQTIDFELLSGSNAQVVLAEESTKSQLQETCEKIIETNRYITEK